MPVGSKVSSELLAAKLCVSRSDRISGAGQVFALQIFPACMGVIYFTGHKANAFHSHIIQRRDLVCLQSYARFYMAAWGEFSPLYHRAKSEEKVSPKGNEC